MKPKEDAKKSNDDSKASINTTLGSPKQQDGGIFGSGLNLKEDPKQEEKSDEVFSSLMDQYENFHKDKANE